MACYQPINAWRTPSGGLLIGNTKLRSELIYLPLPCGKCTGCAQAQAKAWALRCRLELQQHDNAAFTTLTYDDQHVPITLSKRHLQLALKRLRKSLDEFRPGRTLRFFASGEYGERTGRPHYHAILYGLDAAADAHLIDNAWGLGHTRTDTVTPARIAYVAGYTAKKANWHQQAKEERVDPETGEVYTWQPPFIQMSRGGRAGHGIGGHARQHVNSWRLYAISDGHKMPVPRYYKEAWEAQATEQEKQELQEEKNRYSLSRHITIQQLQAGEKIALARQAISADKRKY